LYGYYIHVLLERTAGQVARSDLGMSNYW